MDAWNLVRQIRKSIRIVQERWARRDVACEETMLHVQRRRQGQGCQRVHAMRRQRSCFGFAHVYFLSRQRDDYNSVNVFFVRRERV